MRRLIFRSVVVLLLLLLAESLPSFSAILQLVSSVFVTCLTFVFPPLFYLRLKGQAAREKGEAPASKLEWLLCCQAITVGILGGVLSFVSSIKYIRESSYVPCYIEEMERTC